MRHRADHFLPGADRGDGRIRRPGLDVLRAGVVLSNYVHRRGQDHGGDHYQRSVLPGLRGLMPRV